MENDTPRPRGNALWPRLLGKRIRELRLSRRLTQAQLAEPHLTKGFISQVENGITNASVESLLHIAAGLHVRPADLLILGVPEQSSTACLDLAEAAVALDGPEAGDPWLAMLPRLMDAPAASPSVIIEELVATPLARGRYARYTALVAIKRNEYEAALPLLERALTLTKGYDRELAQLWLGDALCRKGRLREAIRVWEQLVDATGYPLVKQSAGRRLAVLYQNLGDTVEAQRVRRRCDLTPAEFPADDQQRAAAARFLWLLARTAYQCDHLTAATVYARPIPLLVC